MPRVMVLLNEIYLPMKFHVDALHSFKVMLRTKFKNENEQRTINPKVWSFQLWFLCTALLLNEIYLPLKFLVSSLSTVWVMLRTKFKKENEQRAITLKVWCLELWFLCTALFLNEIYLPMKIKVDALHRFRVMLRTKKGQTDGQTDGRGGEVQKKYGFLTLHWSTCTLQYKSILRIRHLSQK